VRAEYAGARRVTQERNRGIASVAIASDVLAPARDMRLSPLP
jgi:hypothetical protein